MVAADKSETRISFAAVAGTTVSTRFSMCENRTPTIRAVVLQSPIWPSEAKSSLSLSLILSGGIWCTVSSRPKSTMSRPKSDLREGVGLVPDLLWVRGGPVGRFVVEVASA